MVKIGTTKLEYTFLGMIPFHNEDHVVGSSFLSKAHKVHEGSFGELFNADVA